MSMTSNEKGQVQIMKTVKEEMLDVLNEQIIQEDPNVIPIILNEFIRIVNLRLDTNIKSWKDSSEHHRKKEEQELLKDNTFFADTHHSMKIYSNGATHGLEFFKNELNG